MNPQPIAYEAIALPLSYLGELMPIYISKLRIIFKISNKKINLFFTSATFLDHKTLLLAKNNPNTAPSNNKGPESPGIG